MMDRFTISFETIDMFILSRVGGQGSIFELELGYMFLVYKMDFRLKRWVSPYTSPRHK